MIFAFVVKGETKTEFLNIVYGLGFYLMWLGVISLVAFAFMYKNEKIKVALSTENKVNTNPTSESNVNIVVKISKRTILLAKFRVYISILTPVI